MPSIKYLDEKLMTILAYSWRYRDLTNRELAKKLHIRNTIISTLIPAGFTVDMIISGWSPLNILGSLLWLVAFYEWRLWFRQRGIVRLKGDNPKIDEDKESEIKFIG